MPRQLDTDARRRELGEAAWRVIRRDGLEHASVRNVAAEAGLSAGSLRHVFPSQSELLGFALELVGERVAARIAALDGSGEARAAVERVLAEIVPLDPDRRAEFEVWLAFVARARVDPALRAGRPRPTRRSWASTAGRSTRSPRAGSSIRASTPGGRRCASARSWTASPSISRWAPAG